MTVTSPQRVIIAGAVASGLSCATRLRRLSEHLQITVLERGPLISYANCGIPYALSDVISPESKLLLQSPEKVKAWFNVDVLINTALIRINRADKTVTILRDGKEEVLGYDKLVLGLGAEPIVPRVEGLEGDGVFTLTTIGDLRGIKSWVKERGVKSVVVLGGAFIGVEAAENLQGMEGIEQVKVVEKEKHLFPLSDGDIVYPVENEMRKNGVKLYTGRSVARVNLKEGKLWLDDGEELGAEMIIVAAGIRARMDIPKEAGLECGKTGVSVNEYMQSVSDEDIYCVGDMIETENRVLGVRTQLALAGPANRQGRLAADNICGRRIKYRGNVGTSVCKVFGKAIGMVGLGERGLERFKLKEKSQKVTVHPVNHAGYYPGSERLTLRIHFETESGKILGAQCVGGDKAGVDKQISVLATAMMGDMTVEDLEHLELAYAPPFGAAKDAVNMGGFVAGNVLRGDVEIVHAGDSDCKLENYQVVDV
ncbi:putative NADH oxidase, partial [Podospora fimiseda]